MILILIVSWLILGSIGRIITRKMETNLISLEVYSSMRQLKAAEIEEDILGPITGPFYLLLVLFHLLFEWHHSKR